MWNPTGKTVGLEPQPCGAIALCSRSFAVTTRIDFHQSCCWFLMVIYSTPVGFFLTRWHRSVRHVAAYRPIVDVSVFIHVTDGVCWVHKLVGSLDWSTLHRLATLGCVTTRPIEPQMAYETPAIELGRLRPNESSASVALR